MNGTPLPDKIKADPDINRYVGRFNNGYPIAIPGEYKENDVVYSKREFNDVNRGKVKVGDKGIVKGPCSDISHEDAQNYVNVDFGYGIVIDVWYRYITKINPQGDTPPATVPAPAAAAAPAALAPATVPAPAAVAAAAVATPPAAPAVAADSAPAEFSPPYQPESMTLTFNEGDTVKYLKDTRQDRLWVIDGIDDEDIMISTEDFVEGEEGWNIVTKDEIVRESGGLKIGEAVTLKTDELPSNIVEQVPLVTLQEKQKEEDKQKQEAATPTLYQKSVTEDSKEEGEVKETDKKEITI